MKVTRLSPLSVMLSCWLLMAMAVGTTHAQSAGLTVRGQVFSTTGKPLAGAFVVLNGVTAHTDAAARFVAQLSPADAIDASAWAPGYNQRVQFLQSTSGGMLTGNVALNFTGSFGLATALKNSMLGAAITHLPLRSSSHRHTVAIRGYSRFPLMPQIYITQPTGYVKIYRLHVAGQTFSARFPLSRKGAYEVGIYTTTALPVFELWFFHAVKPFLPSVPDLTPDPAHATNVTLATYALQMINRDRARSGDRPLVMQPLIQHAALAHSTDMVQHNYFYVHPHVGSDGSTPTQRVQRAGFHTRTVSEAIGAGRTIPLAIQALLNSPFHRNILLGAYRYAGIGVASYEGMLYMTVDVSN